MNHGGGRFSCNFRTGFTWAELLAFVTVVALLAALLTPMLSPGAKHTREEINLVLCGQNLRRIGVGLIAYAQDNAGMLPVCPTVENPHEALVRAVGIPKYVPDPRLFYCPSEQRPALSYSQENFNAGIIGYFYYSAAQASTNENLSKFLLTGISWPHELHTGLDKKSWVMSDIWMSGDPTAHAGYRKGVNYLMLDGGVNFVSESPRQAFH